MVAFFQSSACWQLGVFLTLAALAGAVNNACGEPQSPFQIKAQNPCPAPYLDGSSCTFECAANFLPNDQAASASFTCHDGVWSTNPDFRCLGTKGSTGFCPEFRSVAAPCAALSDPTARFPHSTAGDCVQNVVVNGTSCRPTCSGSYPATGDPLLYCLDGTWTPSPLNPFSCTSCVAMPSTSLPSSEWVVGACNRIVKDGQQCRPGCAPGYGLRGAGAVTCRDAQFQWPSLSALQCVLSCSGGNFPPPAHGGLGSCAADGLEGDVCNYSCDKGFVLVGSPRKCHENAWTVPDNAGAQTCSGASFVCRVQCFSVCWFIQTAVWPCYQRTRPLTALSEHVANSPPSSSIARSSVILVTNYEVATSLADPTPGVRSASPSIAFVGSRGFCVVKPLTLFVQSNVNPFPTKTIEFPTKATPEPAQRAASRVTFASLNATRALSRTALRWFAGRELGQAHRPAFVSS
jgi:hypothetical protein